MNLENGIPVIKEEWNGDYFGEISSSQNIVAPNIPVCRKIEQGIKKEMHFLTKMYCEICAKMFTTQAALTDHMQSHSGETSLNNNRKSRKIYRETCHICQKSFSRPEGLDKHLMIHRGEKPYECEKCGKRFRQSCNLQKHLRVHTGEKPYICLECGKSFAGGLSTHMKTHYRKENIPCEICGKLFANSQGLNNHMRIHTKPYACKKCGKSFSHNSHLQSHERSHSGLANLDNCCFKCEAYFKNIQDLGKHLKNHETNAFQNVKPN